MDESPLASRAETTRNGRSGFIPSEPPIHRPIAVWLESVAVRPLMIRKIKELIIKKVVDATPILGGMSRGGIERRAAGSHQIAAGPSDRSTWDPI